MDYFSLVVSIVKLSLIHTTCGLIKLVMVWYQSDLSDFKRTNHMTAGRDYNFIKKISLSHTISSLIKLIVVRPQLPDSNPKIPQAADRDYYSVKDYVWLVRNDVRSIQNAVWSNYIWFDTCECYTRLSVTFSDIR